MIGILNKDYKYKGMTFKAGSLLYLYSNGNVELGTLKEDYEPIKGLIFKANTTISTRSTSGKIRFGVLKKDLIPIVYCINITIILLSHIFIQKKKKNILVFLSIYVNKYNHWDIRY